MKWFLHDMPVELIGPGPFGMQLRDRMGDTQWVFTKGKEIYECLGKDGPTGAPQGVLSCPNCSWEKRVYKCGNSCGGYITRGGCG